MNKDRIVGKNGGVKDDRQKIRWELLPFDVIEQVAIIMTHGAEKYEDDNWKKVEPARFVGALMRHLCSHLKGEIYDKESGLLHLSHMCCNAVFLVWQQLHSVEPNFKGGYDALIGYFAHLPEDIRLEVNKRLRKLNL